MKTNTIMEYAPCFASLLLASMVQSSLADGVTAGSSALFDTTDYSDTFTGTDDGGIPGRPYVAAGLPAYPIENTHVNPPTNFIQQPGSVFSIASDLGPGFVQGGTPPYPVSLGGNASGAGSDTGFTQTGGNNLGYGVAYGIREEYVVQVDVIQVTDRVDITSSASPGGGGHIFNASSISVFFRGDGSGNASVFDGATDTPIAGQPGYEAFNTGIAAWDDPANGGESRWYNYAVRFDQVDNEIELFVEEVSLAVIDLNTFAGGIYSSGFANNFVGVSTNTGDRTWTDNFQVGGNGPGGMPDGPLPDPGNLPDLPPNLISFWDFDEADGPVEGFLLNFAYDRQADRDGSFQGTVARIPGLIGLGAAQFNDTNGDGVNVGADGYAFTTGVSIEALATTTWDGSDQAELFRKEDGGNRLLFSFQAGGNINNAFGQLVGTEGTPGISFGINVNGAYGELDVAFDGLEGRPDLADVADGNPHHFVATFDGASGDKSIYFDGVLLGSVNLGANATMTSGGGAPALIGASGGGEPFVGVLDEVAVYDAALSITDVSLHFLNFQSGQNYFASGDFRLRIVDFSYDPATSETSVSWTSIPGKRYVVKASTDMILWFELLDVPAATGTISTTDPDPFELSFFFPKLPERFFLRIEEVE